MPRTLLLVDDNSTMRRVVELTFAGTEVDVVTAADVAQAMELATHSRPDIVIADVSVPGCGEGDLAARMRHAPTLSGVPLVLLAGAFDTVDREAALAAGADEVVVKPFDPMALVTRVRELLAGAPTLAEPPPVLPVPVEAPEPAAPAPAAAAPSPDVDRYFEELDEAFAGLALNRRLMPVPSSGMVAAGADDELETTPETASTFPPAGHPAVTPQVKLPSGAGLSSLGEAFAALLTEEQSGGSGVTAAVSPLSFGSPAFDVDRFADQVASRVLERLSEGVVRGIVADLVGDTAERLVREEIERIKRHIT